MAKSQEITATPVHPVRHQRPEPQSMEPVTLNQAMNYAQFISESQLVPEAFRMSKTAKADIVICLQMGSQLGLGAGQSLKSICVINGNPTLWGDGLLAICLSSPLCLDIQEDNTQTIEANQAASCTVIRKGHKPYTHTYTAKTAHDSGLWKRWTGRKLDPYRMLQLKARNFACRNKFADLLMGLQSAEDAQDYEYQQNQPVEPVPPAIDPDALTDSLISEIAHAVSPDALRAIAAQATDSPLPEESLGRIREAYKAKRASFIVEAAPDDTAADT